MFEIKQLLTFMKKHDSSDLFITVGRAPSFRINGAVKPAGKAILTDEAVKELADSTMNEEQQKEFYQKKEMNLALCYPELGRFRVNIYYQREKIAMVIRKIEIDIMTIDDLKLPEVLKDVSMAKRGLVLVVGATGSGKSTSLAAMINHRNENEEGHIITIEDPIEYVHEHKKCVISQREVGVDTDSFKDALKNTLRQAPTAILLGEIRDEETMEHAITFAETGHLCLATLHSNNANQAIERVINFFPPERHAQIYMQLSLNLKGVISQRLVKTVDGGRAAAIEILLGSARVSDVIKNADIDLLKEAIEKGAVEGMQTFDSALYKLYSDGRISMEEALSNADSPTDLKIKIKMGSGADGIQENTAMSMEFEADEEEEEVPETSPFSPTQASVS